MKQSCSNCKHAVALNDDWCCVIASCTMWEKKMTRCKGTWEASSTPHWLVTVRSSGDMRVTNTVVVSGVDDTKEAIDLAQSYFSFLPARKVVKVELLAGAYVRKIKRPPAPPHGTV